MFMKVKDDGHLNDPAAVLATFKSGKA